MLVHCSDPQLIQAAQSGDKAAWDEIIDRYGRLVYSIPRRYGLSDADADDVFQAVFTTVFQKLDRLRDQTRLSAWLITATHRECWRIGRRSKRHDRLDEMIPDVGSPSDDFLEKWEQQHLVREGLRRLGGRCEQLLAALFLEPGEPSYESIAQRFNMSPGSIGPTRARCFKKLEAILVELGLDVPREDQVTQGLSRD